MAHRSPVSRASWSRQALAAGEMALQTAGSLGNFLQLASWLASDRDMLAFPALALAANQDGDLHAETRHLTFGS